jgi:2-C-methyl-D-erythritol 2,4-cyclodiphosphate synthase
MSQHTVRIGQGWDVHALVPGRELVIGGVCIPYHLGLLGHSDADVLLHAITDAMLGAAGLGDIGKHFPDTDPQWKNANSMNLITACLTLLTQRNWRIVNIDSTVIAQAPKLGLHILVMRQHIADALTLDVSQINIKAKTAEKLGPTGQGLAIEAQAVVLIESLG